MFDARVAACLEHVHECGEIRIDIGLRVLQRVSHARLCGEVNHPTRRMPREQLLDTRPIREVDPLEPEKRTLLQDAQTRILKTNVVVLVHDVGAYDRPPLLSEAARDMEANEPCRPS